MGAIKRADGTVRQRAFSPWKPRPYTIEQRGDWIEQAMEAGETNPGAIHAWIIKYVKPDHELTRMDVFNALITRQGRFRNVVRGHWTLEDGS